MAQKLYPIQIQKYGIPKIFIFMKIPKIFIFSNQVLSFGSLRTVHAVLQNLSSKCRIYLIFSCNMKGWVKGDFLGGEKFQGEKPQRTPWIYGVNYFMILFDTECAINKMPNKIRYY